MGPLAPLLLMKMIEGFSTSKEKKDQFNADKERDTELMDLAAHGSDITKDPDDITGILDSPEEEAAEVETAPPKTFKDANRVAASKERKPENVEALASMGEEKPYFDLGEGINNPAFKKPKPFAVPYEVEKATMPSMGQKNNDAAQAGIVELMNMISNDYMGLGSGILKGSEATAREVNKASHGRSEKGGR